MKYSVAILLILSAIVGFGIIGCVSQQEIREEISSARLQAYRRWEQRQKTVEQDEPRIRGQLSLEDALKLSLVNNKALQAVMEEPEIARGGILSSYNGLLPTISLLGSYVRHDDDAYRKQEIGSLNEYSAGIKVIQPIFHGGATQAELQMARLQACYSDERVRQQSETTLYNVTSNYYRVLLARQLLKVTKDAVTSAQAYLKDVICRQESGTATEYNVLRARVDVSLYQAEMIQQQNALNISKTQLLKDMGVSQESEIELTGKLVYHPIEPVFQGAVELAYRNRPDLRQAQAMVEMSEEAIYLTTSRYWPQVNAFAAGGWARPDPHKSINDVWDSEAMVGVSVELSLFDGLRREGQLIESKALLSKRELELLDRQEHAVLQVHQALLSLRDAEQFVGSQRMNRQQAEEGLRLVEVGYSEGVNTEIDVIDARSALTRTMGLHYRAIFDYAMARLAMEKASGTLEAGSSNDL